MPRHRVASLAPLAAVALACVWAPVLHARAGTIVRGTIADLPAAGTFECLAYSQSVQQPRSTGGMATGRPTYEDIVCRKRVDASSPLLLKAASTGQRFRQATFKFY